jgi:hypothetical protein
MHGMNNIKFVKYFMCSQLPEKFDLDGKSTLLHGAMGRLYTGGAKPGELCQGNV